MTRLPPNTFTVPIAQIMVHMSYTITGFDDVQRILANEI